MVFIERAANIIDKRKPGLYGSHLAVSWIR